MLVLFLKNSFYFDHPLKGGKNIKIKIKKR